MIIHIYQNLLNDFFHKNFAFKLIIYISISKRTAMDKTKKKNTSDKIRTTLTVHSFCTSIHHLIYKIFVR